MLPTKDDSNIILLSKSTEKSNSDKMKKNPSVEKGAKWKKYMCSYCNRAFSRSEHRTRHERSHTKERPFHCPKCPSTFVRRDLLLRHDRTVHSSSKNDKSHGHANANPNQLPSIKSGSDKALETLVSLASAKSSSSKEAQSTTTYQITAKKSTTLTLNNRLPLPRLSKDVDYDAALAMTNLYSGGPTSQGITNEKTNHHDHMYSEMMSNTSNNRENSSLGTKLTFNLASQHNLPDTANLLSNHFGNDRRLNASSTPHSSVPAAQQNGTITTFLAETHQKLPRIPQFTKDDEIGHLLRFFAAATNEHSSPVDAVVNELTPSKLMLNRYLSAYFNFFHPQHPFLHLQTFDTVNASPALIFAIGAIGALLCHEEAMAFTLNHHSKMILNSFGEVDRNAQYVSGNVPPLWVTQSLLLCVIYASYIGDPCQLDFIRTGCTTLSLNALKTVTQEQLKWKSTIGSPSWSDWVQHESIKRTFLNVFRVSNGLTTLLNIAPSITNAQVEETGIELPCSEYLWAYEIQKEEHWRDLYSKETIMFYDKIMGWLFNPTDNLYNESSIHLGVFAITVITSAIYLQENSEVRKADSFHKYSAVRKKWERLMHNEADQGWAGNNNICLRSLHSSYPMALESMASLWLRDYHYHPLYRSNLLRMFAAEATMRGIDNSSVQDMLRYCVPQDITSAAVATLNGLIRAGTLKNEQMLGFIIECFSLIFKDFLLCGMNALRDGQIVQGSPLIEDMPYSLHLALLVIFWCFQKEEEMMSTRPNNGQNRVDHRKSTENVVSNSNDLFKLIEKLCSESGTLDRFRQYNQSPRARVSASLCLLYADVLETAKSWGFSTILCNAMKSLAYILLSHRTSATSSIEQTNAMEDRFINDFQNNSGFMAFSSTSLKNPATTFKPSYHDNDNQQLLFRDKPTRDLTTGTSNVNRVIFSKPVVM